MATTRPSRRPAVTASPTGPRQRVFDIGVNANLSQNPVTGTNTIAYMNLAAQSFQPGPAIFGITKTGYPGEQRLAWTSPLPSEWRHLAIVLSGTTGALYVDGGSPTVNSTMTLRPADLGTIDYAYIGRSQFSIDPYGSTGYGVMSHTVPSSSSTA
jgi:hypothetical protein